MSFDELCDNATVSFDNLDLTFDMLEQLSILFGTKNINLFDNRRYSESCGCFGDIEIYINCCDINEEIYLKMKKRIENV